MKVLFCFVLLSAMALHAAELTGKWSGSFDITNAAGETKADSAYMDLKQQDTAITGTAGPNAEKQWALRKGKLDGVKLTFEVESDDGLIVFDLTFDGDSIQGTCSGSDGDGGKMSAKLHLKRLAQSAALTDPSVRVARPGSPVVRVQSR